MNYKEDSEKSRAYKEAQFEELNNYIENLRKASDDDRKAYFVPDMTSPEAYEKSLEGYRKDFADMLGYPLNCIDDFRGEDPVLTEETFVCEDEDTTCHRLVISVGDGLSIYGLFFKPKKEGKLPFMITQSGLGGTPEVCSNFYETTGNYSDMVERTYTRGIATFVPQLMLWGDNRGPAFDRYVFDKDLKQCGSSLTAVEVFKLRRAFDYFEKRDDIDENRMGMLGLSYGGFYTLFTTALDTRIKLALSSCFFNNRYLINRDDWVWNESAKKFLDPEIAMLICPRRLCIEVGKTDEGFAYENVGPEVEKVRKTYEALGIADRFTFNPHPEGHAFDKSDAGMEILKYL
ncbi:MAG: hypothetical protein IKC41_07500 [Clostridia bacterium]|nr:hypothetical protein [Clostridia bacterium]MBR2974035.1 hypothetical protein [Clostridia bacterium]